LTDISQTLTVASKVSRTHQYKSWKSIQHISSCCMQTENRRKYWRQ